MNCPKCRESLVKEQYRKHDYLFCFYCEGAWLDFAGLESAGVLDRPKSSGRDSDFECPSCKFPLKEASFDSVDVEFCEVCECLFFDKSELESSVPHYKNLDLETAGADLESSLGFLVSMANFIGTTRAIFGKLP